MSSNDVKYECHLCKTPFVSDQPTMVQLDKRPKAEWYFECSNCNGNLANNKVVGIYAKEN